MCGIWGSIGAPEGDVVRGWQALAHRGPDAAALRMVEGVDLAHTRLAIQDLDPRSDQPFRAGITTISFNGEIWNHAALRAELAARGPFLTGGDTEVLARLIDAHGAAGLSLAQGMFAVAWTTGDGWLHLARDRFGETPLHYHAGRPFMAASEVKALLAAGASPAKIQWVPPGGLVETDGRTLRVGRWYTTPWRAPELEGATLDETAPEIGRLVEAGALERAVSDVPVCALLSGGIDSAAVALALKRPFPDLVCYTAVMEGGPRADRHAAREVADAVGVELREVFVPAPSADDLRAVVRAIEMPHKAQVEIGWACLQLAERMRVDGFKVTFSGEGSDELWASYGFAHHGIAKDGWVDYRRDLFFGQHRKNFARCNKVFMARGVECRLPFLSTALVEYALGLPEEAVRSRPGRPKEVIQRAYAGRLPAKITSRGKLAFQDGLGLKKAIQAAHGDPRALYARAYAEAFGGVAP
jgi:asparagine synthase (glutamine-hydrolysing)